EGMSHGLAECNASFVLSVNYICSLTPVTGSVGLRI
ncbi:MAG: hypothetical protein JWM57_2962, partial [Phycisphaerales bacterium]|nr:hypothetical protein [Phycisphaerales bacterium]